MNIAVFYVDAGSIDLFILLGGDPAPLVQNLVLKCFLEELLFQGKKIGAICGEASLLAGLGLLNGYTILRTRGIWGSALFHAGYDLLVIIPLLAGEA